METIPYFYIIQHKGSKRKYAGCKWSKGSNPNKFMKEHGYTTSSSHVNKVIKEEGLSSFNVLVIKTESECGMHVYDYETRWLKDHDCAKSNEWINMHNNNSKIFYSCFNNTKDDKTGLTLSEAKTLKTAITKRSMMVDGIPYYKHIGRKISKSHNSIDPETGKTRAKLFGEKISKIRIERGLAKGKNNPQYGKFGKQHPKYGHKHSEETRRKQSESNKKPKNKSPCPHCKRLIDPANMKRWHGNKCKSK